MKITHFIRFFLFLLFILRLLYNLKMANLSCSNVIFILLFMTVAILSSNTIKRGKNIVVLDYDFIEMDEYFWRRRRRRREIISWGRSNYLELHYTILKAPPQYWLWILRSFDLRITQLRAFFDLLFGCFLCVCVCIFNKLWHS